MKKGDRLKGEKIICEARKIKLLKAAPKTSRHKTQRAILKNNAECKIEIETKHNTKDLKK